MRRILAAATPLPAALLGATLLGATLLGAVLLGAAFPGGPALAQAPAWTPPTRDPARIGPGTYHIEPNHTRVLFSVMHMGFTLYYGEFTKASGTLVFDPKDPSRMSVAVSVPVASVSTSNPKLDEELKGPAWLDAARFPEMTFRSTRVTQTGPDTADVAGTLSLHGVTRPVVLHAVLNGGGLNIITGGQDLGFTVTGTIRRSDFGVSTFVPVVSDEVNLIISAAWEK